MNTVKVISAIGDSLGRRIVKFLRLGNHDIQTSIQATPYGVDSNPIKDMVAIYATTESLGSTFIIGYLNKNQLAEPGEVRHFSTDDQGNQKFYTWLKNDGTYEIGGDTNFAVKYNELLHEYNKTRDYLSGLKTATGNLAVILDGVVPGTSAAFNLAMSAFSLGDFSQTKNDKIKTI